MNYLTRLIDVSFREQEDGSVAFFPYGAAGDAYRLESPERYRRIRGFVRRYLLHVLPTVIGVTLAVTLLALWGSGGSPEALAVAAGCFVAVVAVCGSFYRRKVRRLVAGLDTCEASVDVARYLCFPTAFPELYEMNLWAMGFTAAALLGLTVLFPTLDARIAGLCAGAVGLVGGWVKVKGLG